MGVFGFGRDDFENAGAGRRRNAEMKFSERPLRRFIQGERNGVQSVQAGGGDDFRWVRRVGIIVPGGGVGGQAAERVDDRLAVDPAINQGVAKAGLVVRVKSRLLAQRWDRAAGLADENFFYRPGVAADHQQRIGLADRNRGF